MSQPVQPQDAFVAHILRDIAELHDEPLVSTSRKTAGRVITLSQSDLSELSLEQLMHIVSVGRSGSRSALFEDVRRHLFVERGDKATPETNLIPTDIDDRLMAALIILQKYPQNIPEMLSALWEIRSLLQKYITEHHLETSRLSSSHYDAEVVRLRDIVQEIGEYALAHRVPKSDPTMETYLFSGEEKDLRLFLQDPYTLFLDVGYDVHDKHIQEFI